jgi:hypothetical protein
MPGKIFHSLQLMAANGIHFMHHNEGKTQVKEEVICHLIVA